MLQKLYLRYLVHHGWEQCNRTTGMSTSPPLQQGAEETSSQGLKHKHNPAKCLWIRIHTVNSPKQEFQLKLRLCLSLALCFLLLLPLLPNFLAGVSLFTGMPGAFLRGMLSLPDWTWKGHREKTGGLHSGLCRHFVSCDLVGVRTVRANTLEEKKTHSSVKMLQTLHLFYDTLAPQYLSLSQQKEKLYKLKILCHCLE